MLERVGVPVEHVDEDVDEAAANGVPSQAEAPDTTFGTAVTAMGLFFRKGSAVDAGAARQLVSDGAVLLDVREPGSGTPGTRRRRSTSPWAAWPSPTAGSPPGARSSSCAGRAIARSTRSRPCAPPESTP